ncbi:UNC-like C-terminal-domain-containing protein [Schizophyllum commune]
MVALASLSAFLLLTTPAIAQTSPNDPLRAIAIAAPPHPEAPICCLVQPTDQEATEEDVLLSFEEWKAKQFATQQQTQTRAQGDANRSESTTGSSAPVNAGETNSDGGETQPPAAVDSPGGTDGAGAAANEAGAEEPMSLHFKVPLTDRFNYASSDCSARVHASHKGAKSAHSILSSKRDRYMLSPCDTKTPQFVVVELCEDIRIDTVQLANFEFFSGVFKDFTVSVAKRYTTDESEWTVAGTYQAKNVRGVQSFHPPTSLRDFYRYIRIDFHSHYGNEYYCPVSLLRVYGLTHLEQWKWEAWEEESRARIAGSSALPASSSADPTKVAEEPQAAATANEQASSSESTDRSGRGPRTPQTTALPSTTEVSVSATSSATASSTSPSSPSGSPTSQSVPTTAAGNDSNAQSTDGPQPTSSVSLTSEGSSISKPPGEQADDSTATSSITTTITASQNVQTGVNSVSLAPPLAAATGESIYRTIMNRLTALEANQTLYIRYFEDQAAGVREVLRRLTEDVGRLQALGKTQSQNYHRTAAEWDRQRLRLQADYDELISKVNYLSDEVILEKRLSIAQLCLLLAVLIFLATTRGSNVDVVHPSPAMRAWGRRKLSMSGHWVMDRLRNGRGREDSDASISREHLAQRSRENNEVLSEEEIHNNRMRDINSRSVDLSDPTERNVDLDGSKENVPTPKRRPARLVISTRPRAPSLRTPTRRHMNGGLATPTRAGNLQWPATVTRAVDIALDRGTGTPSRSEAETIRAQRPATVQRSSFAFGKPERPALLLRSNSGGTVLPPSGSWHGPQRKPQRSARAAHLHEVHASYSRSRDGEDGDEKGAGDRKGKGRASGDGEDGEWVDTSESEAEGDTGSSPSHGRRARPRRRNSTPSESQSNRSGLSLAPGPSTHVSHASAPDALSTPSAASIRSPERRPRTPRTTSPPAPVSPPPASRTSPAQSSSYCGPGSSLHGPQSPILPSSPLHVR